MERKLSETAPAPVSETEIVERIIAGDWRIFEALMRQHNRRLFRVARAILNDDGEAEEALQEAYLLAFQRIGQFQGKSKLATWLTRIVINQALQRRRRNRRDDVVVPLTGLETDEGAAAMSTETSSDAPERATLRAEVRRLLERAIGELPLAFRTVFILREVEDLSVEETAECLEVPEATVRTRLFRAKSLLRESLARELDLATTDTFEFAGARCDRIVSNVLAQIETLIDARKP